MDGVLGACNILREEARAAREAALYYMYGITRFGFEQGRLLQNSFTQSRRESGTLDSICFSSPAPSSIFAYRQPNPQTPSLHFGKKKPPVTEQPRQPIEVPDPARSTQPSQPAYFPAAGLLGASPPTSNLYPSAPFSVLKSFASTFLSPIPGNVNASLLPPSSPFQAPTFSQFVHVNAPTHGCTFQPNSSVTLALFCSLPVRSVIWYFGRCASSLNMPRG